MFDFAIIGGGPTGYAAAMYAGRLNLQVIIFSKSPGGLIITTDIVENYPGFQSVTGFEIFRKIQNHAREYPMKEIEGEVAKIEQKEEGSHKYFVIHTTKESYEAKSLLFATGAQYKKLNVPNVNDFLNKGIHYCALCDGYAYKNKTVGVIGGADSAAKEALELAQHAQKVYIICRGPEIKPEPINKNRVDENSRITIVPNTNVVQIGGEGKLQWATLDTPYQGNTQLPLDALFIAIGHDPVSKLAEDLGVALNQKKEVMINRYTQTSIPGVYAAGDVADTAFKQLITGCAEGVMAAYQAFEYVRGK